MIQKISDKRIDGDESVNIEKNIEESIEKDIEKDIEKGIEEGIKEVLKQIIEKVVEEINIEESTGDPPKLRRSDRDKKQIRKFLTYYRDFREMKNKRSGYEKEYKI
jgi:hypothetical protein